MKILKNLFGNHTKIHASNIRSGNPATSRQVDKILAAPSSPALSNWLKEQAETDDFFAFAINSSAGGLPSNEFNYGTGFVIKRFNSILFILIIATDGRVATRTFNYGSDSWTSWRII